MRALVPVLLAVLTTACGWPSHVFREIEIDGARDSMLGSDAESDAAFDGSSDGVDTLDVTDGTSRDVRAETPPATDCPPNAKRANACDVLQAFPGAFVTDGRGDEFCSEDGGVPENPPRRFSVVEAGRTEPSPAPAGFPEKVEIRAGLDSYGVHVFVKIQDDPRILVDLANPVQGDAIEIYLRGTVTDRGLTGVHEDDDAHMIVITPPGETADGVAALYRGGVRRLAIAGELWHSRRVAGGWEAELHYPWTTLKNQAQPGMTVGFDVALDVKDDPAAPGRQVRAYLFHQVVIDSPACTAVGSATGEPWCDDRTWCVAKAYLP